MDELEKFFEDIKSVIEFEGIYKEELNKLLAIAKLAVEAIEEIDEEVVNKNSLEYPKWFRELTRTTLTQINNLIKEK